ncbi:NAD(P)-binding protein [Melanomma pulvis-pyrius CBS 109.77]|uniref:NAD(P)-binding protein n=1 Tax=Melanomma pulvis-pyrius CBS 109.77 TaxID=1314802 RepID=A0A6A6XE78_9PLEO|nr:NAD(P)-binding protein [Melanomma pulvis-pyrius CBS 109.77]
MSTRIFLTGATGFVGGDALQRIALSNIFKPNISCLIRDVEKGAQVSKSYPNIRIVHGDLDDVKFIENEARNSDIVVHLASTSHTESALAISRGLADPSRKKPAHWIQMSGATLLAAKEIAEGRFGFKVDKTYDDVKDADEIMSIITGSPKRAVDNLVISQDPASIQTALIVGPLIYGTGKGPGNKRSIQAPEIARVTLEQKEGFRLGEGENRWSNIHVHDLSELISLLVEAAANSKTGLWNRDGVYLPENGKLEFGELSTQIAVEAHKQGLIPDASMHKVINPKEADALSGHASILWGTNALLHSSKANSILNWTPSGPSLSEEIPKIVSAEAERLKATRDS